MCTFLALSRMSSHIPPRVACAHWCQVWGHCSRPKKKNQKKKKGGFPPTHCLGSELSPHMRNLSKSSPPPTSPVRLINSKTLFSSHIQQTTAQLHLWLCWLKYKTHAYFCHYMSSLPYPLLLCGCKGHRMNVCYLFYQNSARVSPSGELIQGRWKGCVHMFTCRGKCNQMVEIALLLLIVANQNVSGTESDSSELLLALVQYLPGKCLSSNTT